MQVPDAERLVEEIERDFSGGWRYLEVGSEKGGCSVWNEAERIVYSFKKNQKRERVSYSLLSATIHKFLDYVAAITSLSSGPHVSMNFNLFKLATARFLSTALLHVDRNCS